MSPDRSGGGPASGLATAVAALAKLPQIAEGQVTGVMLVLQDAPHPPDVSQLRPTERALPILNGVVRDAAASFADCEVIAYEPATSPADGEIMSINVAAVPLLKAIVDECEDLADMPVFDPSATRLSNLQLAVIRSEGVDGSAVFLQSLRGNQIVAQSRRVGVIVRRGIIDLPPRGEMLLFSRDVAAVVVGDVALFRDRAAFQRLFGYLDELRERAAATFQSVTAQLRISGFDAMAAAVTGSPAMLGKMASIQRKLDQYPQYREALTMPKLIKFVRQHDECEVEIAGDGNAARLVFRNDPQHRFKILKLLDDDYLRSELTTLQYETNSKSAPIGGT